MIIEGYTENVKRLLAQKRNVLFIFPHQYAAMDYFDLAAQYFRNFSSRKSKYELLFDQRILLRGIIIKNPDDPIYSFMRGFQGPVVLYPRPYDFHPAAKRRMIQVVWGHNTRWEKLIKYSGVQPLNEEELKPWQR